MMARASLRPSPCNPLSSLRRLEHIFDMSTADPGHHKVWINKASNRLCPTDFSCHLRPNHGGLPFRAPCAAMVRILTYNVHSGVGTDGVYELDRVAGVIRRTGADIACLQEALFVSFNLRW